MVMDPIENLRPWISHTGTTTLIWTGRLVPESRAVLVVVAGNSSVFVSRSKHVINYFALLLPVEIRCMLLFDG